MQATGAANLKRKMTDPTLKVVTVDPFYDLTLIVGTPGRTNGQVAFRVNKGSLRHASDIWTKMLTGVWAESKQTEIEFPDDNPQAFHVVLLIAHLQIGALPAQLGLVDMMNLAILTDKYNLVKLIRVALGSKHWLDTARRTIWREWPAHPQIQDYAFITQVFDSQDDYRYLINRLAVEIQVDEDGTWLSHGAGGAELKSTLPDRVLTHIHHIRTSILQEWITVCNTAIDDAIRKRNDGPSTACGKTTCKATKIGIMMIGLQAAGLYPGPESAKAMHRSVASYWRDLKDIGVDFKNYRPCASTSSDGRGSHHSTCSFGKCFGDFGILGEAEATLRRAEIANRTGLITWKHSSEIVFQITTALDSADTLPHYL
ncbi:hypothetical protein EKO04_003371 [Ascochyta lentis]|uniref:BTB domain-containing protein n=1 Tax=Ascochyta lentis TaxID=205686 RepID=A0A8H7J819_9PLEO|nr:hypothetical protein EKO04_003371 [Ascochyta lentis]